MSGTTETPENVSEMRRIAEERVRSALPALKVDAKRH